jgi:hypothetical protein
VRNVYTILVRKLEGKKLLGRARCRFEIMDQIDLTQNRDHWQTIPDTLLNLSVTAQLLLLKKSIHFHFTFY